MLNVKRIEIIVPEHLVPDLLRLIELRGIAGYTLMRGLSGRGGQRRPYGTDPDPKRTRSMTSAVEERAIAVVRSAIAPRRDDGGADR